MASHLGAWVGVSLFLSLSLFRRSSALQYSRPIIAEETTGNQIQEGILRRLEREEYAVGRLTIPKVALLFLSHGEMPHEQAWAAWLGAARRLVPMSHLPPRVCEVNDSLQQYHGEERVQGTPQRLRRSIFIQQALFSIYVHPSPEFEEFPQDSVFYGRSLAERVRVGGGLQSEVEARQLLLKAALANPLNQRFVFLCDLTIPLYSPTVVYSQLMSEQKSRIDACPKREPQGSAFKIGFWTPSMSPAVPESKWRRSGAWVGLLRSHAELITQDTKVVAAFKEHCKKKAADHYFAIVLALNGLESETFCASSILSPEHRQWAGTLAGYPFYVPNDVNATFMINKRHGSAQHVASSACKDTQAIWAAAGTFAEVDESWRVGCHWRAGLFNSALLPSSSCVLFTRRVSALAINQVNKVITSCDSRLQIAPRPDCHARTSSKHKPGEAVIGSQSQIWR